MLGDSLMRLHFFSLGCLLRSHVASGRGVTWDRSDIKWKGDYTAKLDGREIQVQLPHQLQWCICLVISFLVGSCAIHVQAVVALSLSLFNLLLNCAGRQTLISGSLQSSKPSQRKGKYDILGWGESPMNFVFRATGAFAGGEAVCGRVPADERGPGVRARLWRVQPDAVRRPPVRFCAAAKRWRAVAQLGGLVPPLCVGV